MVHGVMYNSGILKFVQVTRGLQSKAGHSSLDTIMRAGSAATGALRRENARGKQRSAYEHAHHKKKSQTRLACPQRGASFNITPADSESEVNGRTLKRIARPGYCFCRRAIEHARRYRREISMTSAVCEKLVARSPTPASLHSSGRRVL
ncbi:hypothetical protein EVAR_36830_1 [Eumeta japonica]|uniref:Uncharacterized protein n=1 Tax=Eumeta variegata TaxID=151549 RepID=A0A4C1WAI0_EUMVA|nr:hypothetical protein EVAR_36830_1 [Eumeta japonica]